MQNFNIGLGLNHLFFLLKNMKKPLIIIAVVLLIAGLGFYFYNTNSTSNLQGSFKELMEGAEPISATDEDVRNEEKNTNNSGKDSDNRQRSAGSQKP